MTAIGTLCAVSVLVLTVAAVDIASDTPPQPPTFPSTFWIEGTYTLGDEGVVVNNTLFFNATGGVRDAVDTTANGYMRSLMLANASDPREGRLYFIYRINKADVCYAYRITLPTPMPTPSLANLRYIRAGLMQRSGVWGTSLGRMQLRVEAPLTISDGCRIFATNDEGCEGVTASTMTVSGQPHRPFVPAACDKAHAVEATVSMDAVSRHPRAVPVDRPPWHKRRTPRINVLALHSDVDNRAFATPVRNQGKLCGGCWAFASAAATEVVYYRHRNVTNPLRWFSPQQLIDCSHGDLNGTALIPAKGCFGGWPTVAMNSIVKHGAAWEDAYTFDGVTGSACAPVEKPVFALGGFALVHPPAGPNNVHALMEAVASQGAAVVIISVPPSLIFWGGGAVYDDVSCTPSLQHAVTIVGYGTDTASGLHYWLIKNSFGRGWGDLGFFRMVRGKNMCGVEDYGFLPKPLGSPL